LKGSIYRREDPDQGHKRRLRIRIFLRGKNAIITVSTGVFTSRLTLNCVRNRRSDFLKVFKANILLRKRDFDALFFKSLGN